MKKSPQRKKLRQLAAFHAYQQRGLLQRVWATTDRMGEFAPEVRLDFDEGPELDEEVIQDLLRKLNHTQDSVQSIAKTLIKYPSEAATIVELW